MEVASSVAKFRWWGRLPWALAFPYDNNASSPDAHLIPDATWNIALDINETHRLRIHVALSVIDVQKSVEVWNSFSAFSAYKSFKPFDSFIAVIVHAANAFIVRKLAARTGNRWYTRFADIVRSR